MTKHKDGAAKTLDNNFSYTWTQWQLQLGGGSSKLLYKVGNNSALAYFQFLVMFEIFVIENLDSKIIFNDFIFEAP